MTQQPHDEHDHGAFHAQAGTTPVRILVVCTGNSARSILGEAMFRHVGGEQVEVHSAGTHPSTVNPLAIRVLGEAGLPTDGLHSKSVTEFLGQQFDYVITVCDDARDACPVFPGVHETMHWSYPDPAKVEGTEEQRLAAFRSVFTGLGQRIHQFLPLAERYTATRRSVELA
ncbi:MAG: arsenate reductase ArsC [Candidatus Limnocylindrales bacterium]